MQRVFVEEGVQVRWGLLNLSAKFLDGIKGVLPEDRLALVPGEGHGLFVVVVGISEIDREREREREMRAARWSGWEPKRSEGRGESRRLTWERKFRSWTHATRLIPILGSR